MAQAPHEPDRVSTFVFVLAAVGVLAIIAYAAYSHFHTKSEAAAVDDDHHDRSRIEELEDENAQLQREKRAAEEAKEAAEDKLSHKRSCVEDADSIEEAKDCF